MDRKSGKLGRTVQGPERKRSSDVQLLKWVNHGNKRARAIYSLDVQHRRSDGDHGQRLRFATGGADEKVRIWKMPQTADKGAGRGNLLATVHEHCSAVNCVRWSRDGRYLAASSGDCTVSVHELQSEDMASTDQHSQVENWGLVKRLYGHKMDVVGVDWSSTDSMLVSCSLDGTVRVWDTSTWETLCLLRHGSYVKGVAWHPGGNQFAAQLEDKRLVVWCGDSGWKSGTRSCFLPGLWNKEANLFSARPSWSPCGQCLVAPAGRTHDHPYAAPVVATSNWKARSYLPGHAAPVNAVKFHHALFRDAAQPEVPAYGVVAVASQDRSLSVWTTENPPHRICKTRAVFKNDVTDLAWSADGYTLLASAADGRVRMIAFDASAMLGEMVLDDSDDSDPAGKVEETLVATTPDLDPDPPQHVDGANDQDSPAQSPPPYVVVQSDLSRTRVDEKTAWSHPPVSHPAVRDPPLGTPRVVPSMETEEGEIISVTPCPASCPATRDSPLPTRTFLEKPRPAKQSAGTSDKTLDDSAPYLPQLDRRGDVQQRPRVPIGDLKRELTSVAYAEDDTAEVRTVFSGRWPGKIMRTKSMVTITCAAGGGDGPVVWEDRIMGKSTYIVANSFFCAVVMESGYLHLYVQGSDARGPACRKRMPLRYCPSWGRVVFMVCYEGNWSLLLCSSRGNTHIWDVQAEPITCAVGPNIKSCKIFSGQQLSEPVEVKLSDTGHPVIGLQDGREYMFQQRLGTWVSAKLGETSGAEEVSNSDGATICRSSLMAKIDSAESDQEYRDSLVSYARLLMSHSDVRRLRKLCEGLLNAECKLPDIHPTLGVSRRSVLLDDILPVMSEHQAGSVQELMEEFQELLSDRPLQELLTQF